MTRTPEIVCLGCVPIVDNERTNAYVKNAQAIGAFMPGCCPQVDLTFCDLDTPEEPYTDPATDGVCWYDPDVPESADFLGLWVIDLDGMQNDGYNRGTSDLGGEGSVFTRPLRPGKVLTFDVMLFATSCCGMEYGRDWLANVLRGQGCAHGTSRFDDLCGTTELKVRVCCPDEGASDIGMRIFPTASLTQGLARADGERRDKCCCTYQRFTFVITTGTPDSFGLPEVVCEDSALDVENAQCTLCLPDIIVPETCVDPMGCGDLFLEAFESPSLRDDCYCPPIEQTRNCCCVDEFQSGSTSRSLIIDLYSGSDPDSLRFTTLGARNVQILIWENPKRLPCPTTQEEFDYFVNNVPVCARITVGYIPPASLLRIDGRTGEAYIVCTGKTIPIYDGVEGDLKKLETGCNPLVVCSLWDRFNSVFPPADRPSTMTVSVARRFS